jgi:hypothetical protein
MRHSRLDKAKNVANFKSEIQIVDTHEFEWRGLNFDATPRTSTWEFVVT